MKIAIIGAGGKAGQAILAEALQRGLNTTAIQFPKRLPP